MISVTFTTFHLVLKQVTTTEHKCDKLLSHPNDYYKAVPGFDISGGPMARGHSATVEPNPEFTDAGLEAPVHIPYLLTEINTFWLLKKYIYQCFFVSSI